MGSRLVALGGLLEHNQLARVQMHLLRQINLKNRAKVSIHQR